MRAPQHLASILLLLTAIPGTVHADVSSHPCMMALAQGSLEERRAQFERALALFEQARKEPLCEVEAQIGMARTFNSVNDHKKALTAAQWVLDHSDDPELLAEAHYEIGRGLHKPGRRMTQDKTAAAAAYQEAIELSEGRHRAAVRALMRLYQETRQEERLAELHEQFPDIRSSNRAQQLRTIASKPKPRAPADPTASAQDEPSPPGHPGATGEPASPKAPGGSRDCSTRKAPAPPESWELDLPRFCGPGTDSDTDRRPWKVSAPQPQYPEKARKAKTQGAVEFEALAGTDGAIEAVRVLNSVSPELDESTLDAVCKWRFETAADSAGQPTRYYTCGTVNFRLQ